MKKSIKILLIILAVIVLLAIATIVLVKTDVLKFGEDSTDSNKGILSMGAEIYDDAKDFADASSDRISDMMVASFNEQFLAFCGNNMRGSTVISLISRIESSNLQNPDSQVSTNITSVNDIDKSATYNIVESYNNKTGMINKITITMN